MLEKAVKIGIFGGTLNPIHHGHLIVAEAVREKFCLDKVLFIPTGCPPHKVDTGVIPAMHRYNMVKCAIKGNPYFEASQLEITRTGYTYTVDTLSVLKAEYGNNAELFFIIGGDVVPELTAWKDYKKVFSMCSFIAVLRPGYDEEAFLCSIKELQECASARIFSAETPLIDISSTKIRERIKQANTIKYLVPQCVEEYIYNNGLYK